MLRQAYKRELDQVPCKVLDEYRAKLEKIEKDIETFSNARAIREQERKESRRARLAKE